MIVGPDQEVNDVLRQRLVNFAAQGRIRDTVSVTVVERATPE